MPLSELLDSLEVDLGKVGQQVEPEAALSMLIKIDVAFIKIKEMNERGFNPKAEKAQLEYIISSLKKMPHQFLTDIGGKDVMVQFRKDFNPSPEQTWWYLDDLVKQQSQKRLRSLILGTFFTALLIIGFVILYQKFLAPDPIVAKKYILQLDADQSLIRGGFQEALAFINQVIALDPDDAGTLILRGVIYSKLGEIEKGLSDFLTAEKILSNREKFLLLRSESWLKVGEAENALKDAQEIIAINPISAEGYYFLGRAFEKLNQYVKAEESYNQASILADQQGKNELNAAIRVSLAMMIQSLPESIPTSINQPAK